jgi:pimeloyl-ACP methyl ester carboxylesterase
MAARVNAGRGFLPLSLARMNIWILAGFSAGAAVASWALYKRPEIPSREVISALALASAFLAAGPTLSWLFTGVLAAALGLLYYFL